MVDNSDLSNLGAPGAAGGTPVAAAGSYVIDSTQERFGEDVIEASKDVPVIVDFWAPWCGPCKQLGPALEKLTEAAAGAVRLVKINVDENQALAAQLRIQSIPTVYAFKDGRGIDGFQGALPESQLKTFFENLIGEMGPSASDVHLEEARALLDAGQTEEAAAHFGAVLQAEPENTAALAGLAACETAAGNFEAAHKWLSAVPLASQSDPQVAAARAALELAENAGLAQTDLAPLLAAIEANPKDMGARMDLAEAQLAAHANEDAIDTLLEMVRLDRKWNDEAARKKLLTLFDAFGPMSELSQSARRRLSSLLFS